MFEHEVNWYAVTTRSRHEKAVAEQLWQKEIECFLPLREVISKWKDRRKKVQFPLFPGHCQVNDPDRDSPPNDRSPAIPQQTHVTSLQSEKARARRSRW